MGKHGYSAKVAVVSASAVRAAWEGGTAISAPTVTMAGGASGCRISSAIKTGDYRPAAWFSFCAASRRSTSLTML